MPFDTEIYSQRYCKRSHRELAYQERKANRSANGSTREIQLTLIPSTQPAEADTETV
ncbi:MAG: hypothetical protein QY332_14680 [Anaerolineales bacterium]|nr:MAG: hypothetical protein QY332_14680 [Anaerolineales bacterium]